MKKSVFVTLLMMGAVLVSSAVFALPPVVNMGFPVVRTGLVNENFGYSVEASDPNAFSDPEGEDLSYYLKSGCPAWMSGWNSDTGTFQGVPSAGDAGTYEITILAWDRNSPTTPEAKLVIRIDRQPVAISTCEELQNMQNDLTGDYMLAADIDCSGTAVWNNGAGFKPIGGLSSTTTFKGALDGNNHQIGNLRINRNQSGVGLFSGIQGARIQNIRLTGVDIKGASQVGGLCGYAMNGSTVANVHVGGRVTGTGAYVGGVAGVSSGAPISQSSFTGDVVSSNYYVGGLVGYVTNTQVAESYSRGSVSGLSYVGGLVGRLNGTVSDSYSDSDADGSVSGGLVGSGGNLTNCYATGTVSNRTPYATYAGGLSATNGPVRAVSSYWNPDDSGTVSSGGGTKTTQEAMRRKATYSGWDFGGTWDIRERTSCPTLQWQSEYGLNRPAAEWNGFPETVHANVNRGFGYCIADNNPEAFYDPDGDAISYYLKSSAPWMSAWDSATGTFSGIPTEKDAGVWVIGIIGWDGIAPTWAEKDMTIWVNRPPAANAPIPPVVASVGAFRWTVPANAFADPDHDDLTYYIRGMPEWAENFSPDAGALTGTIPPDAVGRTYEVTIVAWDNVVPWNGNDFAETAESAFTISVTENGDLDSDGIPDRDETAVYGTRPDNPDTDGDGIWDGDELAFAGNAWNSDADGDGRNRLLDWDSDGDGVSDGLQDSDGDGIGDWLAFKLGIAGAQPEISKTYRYNTKSEIVWAGPAVSAK